MRARIDTFITAISKLRLGILTEQGEGACSFFRSSFNLFFIYFIYPETRSIIIRVKFRVMMASFKFVERGVFGPDHPPRRRPQASQERHFNYCIVNTFQIPGNHHASVRNLEDVGGSDFKLDPDSERSIEC